MTDQLPPADQDGRAMLRDLDPRLHEAIEDLLAATTRDGVLTPRVRWLIRITLAAQVTTRDRRGLGRAVPEALRAGVTPAEILEVLALVAQQGMSSLGTGIPVLLDELAAADRPLEDGPLDVGRAAIKDVMTTSGPRPRPWTPMFEALLRLDPDYCRSLAGFIDVPWASGSLEPKVRELVTVAMDVACTHLYANGLRRHVRKALAEGATAEEVLEVMKLAATTALLSVDDLVPLLIQHGGGDPV